jgi:hypothetical protein
MACANCGAEHHERASFCHYCGIQLAGIETTPRSGDFNRIFSSDWLRSKAQALPRLFAKPAKPATTLRLRG